MSENKTLVEAEMLRPDRRKSDELREITVIEGFTKHADGSILMCFGDTKVLCTASVEDRVPPFLRGKEEGWITAEYAMLPSSTETRKPRDRNGRVDGRSVEIQRLIGRSLRSVVDLKKLGERTITLDCDVLQADGGTRTASITGAYIALVHAVKKLMEEGKIEENPITGNVAAVSVGVRDGEPILDLNYIEDSGAEVDMNFVMNEKEEFIEIQGTGEERPFTKAEFSRLMELAEKGIKQLIRIQNEHMK